MLIFQGSELIFYVRSLSNLYKTKIIMLFVFVKGSLYYPGFKWGTWNVSQSH